MVPKIEWEPCSEDNYPEENEICLIKMMNPMSKDWEYYEYSHCFMGWGTLIKRDAYCAKFKKS